MSVCITPTSTALPGRVREFRWPRSQTVWVHDG